MNQNIFNFFETLPHRKSIVRFHDLTGMNLDYKILDNEDLSFTCFAFCSLRFAQMNYCDFSYADFNNVDMRNSSLKGSILVGANLMNAQIENADLSFAVFNEETILPFDTLEAYKKGMRPLFQH